jgi:hypothetical protein
MYKYYIGKDGKPREHFVYTGGEMCCTGPMGSIIREIHTRGFREINNTLQLRATLRAGAYTSLGSYPLVLYTADGATLHFKCAREQYRQISDAIRHKCNSGWRVTFCDVNYDDTAMTCAHCNEPIESAYGDADTTNNEEQS